MRRSADFEKKVFLMVKRDRIKKGAKTWKQGKEIVIDPRKTQ